MISLINTSEMYFFAVYQNRPPHVQKTIGLVLTQADDIFLLISQIDTTNMYTHVQQYDKTFYDNI